MKLTLFIKYYLLDTIREFLLIWNTSNSSSLVLKDKVDVIY